MADPPIQPNQSHDPDTEWMLQAKEGDLSGFNAILDKYQKPIYNFFLRFFGNPSAAEDAAQQLFVQLYKALPRYRPLSKFSTYLYRMAKNLAINISRRNSFLSFFSLEDPLFTQQLEESSSQRPEKILERKEETDLIQKALLKLPGRQRLAVLLFYFEECSMQETAERMECSAASVESLLFRARQSLKNILSPSQGDGFKKLACFIWVGTFSLLAAGTHANAKESASVSRWVLCVIPSNEKSSAGDWVKVLEQSKNLALTAAFSPPDMAVIPDPLRKRLMELKSKEKLEPCLRLEGDPILPLLYDINIAKGFVSADTFLPSASIAWPEDITTQIARSKLRYVSFWEEAPRGFLPGGGCLSLEVCDLLRKQGLVWTLGSFPEKEWPRGAVLDLEEGFKNSFHIFSVDSLSNVFHENVLSPMKSMVKNLMEELKKNSGGAPLILVYDESRSKIPLSQMLAELDRFLEPAKKIKMVSLSTALQIRSETENSSLSQVWPHSWPWMKGEGVPPGPGLTVWLGSAETNASWEILSQARDAIEHYKNSGAAELKVLDHAMDEFYSAESGKFFEGARNYKRKGQENKMLFKATLANVFRILEAPRPPSLDAASFEDGSTFSRDSRTQNSRKIQSEAKDCWIQWAVPATSTGSGVRQFSVEVTSAPAAGAEINLLFSWDENIEKPEILELYIDVNHRLGAGAIDLLSGRGGILDGQDAWEYVLSCRRSGAEWECGLFQGKNPAPILKAAGREKWGHSLEVKIPQDRMGRDPLRWGYLVCIINAETGALQDILGNETLLSEEPGQKRLSMLRKNE